MYSIPWNLREKDLGKKLKKGELERSIKIPNTSMELPKSFIAWKKLAAIILA